MPVEPPLSKLNRFKKYAGDCIMAELIFAARRAADGDKEESGGFHPGRRNMRQLAPARESGRVGVHAKTADRAGPPYHGTHAQNFRCFTVSPLLMSCLRESRPMR